MNTARTTLLVLLFSTLVGCSGASSPETPDVGLGAGTDIVAADTMSTDLISADSQAAQDADDASLLRDVPRQDTGPRPAVGENILDDTALLVVTSDGLAAAFAPFVERKRTLGIPTELVTLSEIDAAVRGGDGPARIRSYLKTRAARSHLRWVLLGGDSDVVPRREVHCSADVTSEETFVDTDVTSELYYADLDGDWDGDGDGVLAEPNDGLDLTAELIVARLPVETAAEVATYLRKLIAWESALHPDYQDKVLFLGEWAGYGMNGGDIYSSAGMDLFLKPSIPASIDLTRLYEDSQTYPGSEPNTERNQRQAMADGQALAIDFGHGNVPTLCKLSGDEILSLRDTGRPGVFWTTECYAGMFDASQPCGGELFIRAPGGGIAYMGNADFGVGFPSFMDITMAAVKRLYGEGEMRLGDLVYEAVSKIVGPSTAHTEDDVDRWTALTFVLFGDPTLLLWKGPARVPELTISDDDDSVTIEVTAEGQPVEGAHIALYAPSRFLYVVDTDAQGHAVLRAEEPLGDDWTLSVSGQNLAATVR